MTKGLLGKKIGMTQLFDKNGDVIPATVIQAGPCYVTQIKTGEREKYHAIQLGFDDKKPSRTTKPLQGHFQKANTNPKKFVREIRIDAEEIKNYELGQVLKADIFKEGEKVDITGISKGRGFAGVMKRHNFHGFKASHGTHEYFRHGGSIGTSATPGRVLKGTKMAGHMGNARVTIQNIHILKVDPEKDLLVIRGSVPGPNRGYLIIKKAVKGQDRTSA